MQTVAERAVERAKELFKAGEVARVLGWERGEFDYERTPALFETEEELKGLVYDEYCGANVSKMLIAASRLPGKTLAMVKPCDALSLNQLIAEHRVNRENVYVLGVGSAGMKDKDGEVLLKCKFCKTKEFPRVSEANLEKPEAQRMGAEPGTAERPGRATIADEIIDDEACRELPKLDRFAGVQLIEDKTPEERFQFWHSELSKCIRCNACRNVCPACSCLKCVFDNPASGVDAKANVNDFEENMFHIIRAYHVAGRCTDCGECSRVCPQAIPLHLLNRKFIKDINALYGEYQADADADARGPLTDYTESDAEPSVVLNRGE